MARPQIISTIIAFNQPKLPQSCHERIRILAMLLHTTNGDFILLAPRYSLAISTPIPQPPRSAELNPVEHIWEEVREKHFYNRVFDSMHDVIDTLCQGLRELMDMPERLRSLTNFPHLRITF